MSDKEMRLFLRILFLSCILAAGVVLSGCKRGGESQSSGVERMNQIGQAYLKLALAVGQHDPAYIDAYYGPQEWQDAANAEKKSLATIKQETSPLVTELGGLDLSNQEEIVHLRQQYLIKQLQSLASRVEMLEGKKQSFDEESKNLYDAVAPTYPESYFKEKLGRLETMLPGDGPLISRFERYKRDFVIPKEKLDAVFKAAIEEARRRTLAHIALPAGESFVVEYVTNKSWSGYNWYKGNSHSLIQINTDLPIYIDRAIDLASHEGYPGHHVYNVLLEAMLVKDRGWVEFSVYPLFSPQSLIAEGSANFGIEVAFPSSERLAFERAVLFPLAGLPPSKAERYYEIHKIVSELAYAGNEAARGYLNGQLDSVKAVQWLTTYAMMPMDRARQRIKFFDQYRSYVINYNLGQDLVKNYIEMKGGTADRPDVRWKEFEKLISSPRLPSGLRPEAK
jgi:hypothetical protein